MPGALDALQLALDAAAGQGETEAWTRVQLSKAYFSVGRFAPALAQAHAARCGPSPATRSAYDALAWAEYGRGHVQAGDRARSRKRSNRIPLPQYVAMLGDL